MDFHERGASYRNADHWELCASRGSSSGGYLVAEDVKFEVKDTGEIQKVVMEDKKEPVEETEIPETPNRIRPRQMHQRQEIIRRWELSYWLAA